MKNKATRTHGGARPGAGAPQTTIVLRVGDIIVANVIEPDGGVTDPMTCRVERVKGRACGSKLIALERLPQEAEFERNATSPQQVKGD